MEAKNLIRVEFECNSVPTYHKTVNKRWVEWGKDNAYPYYLMTLYNRNAYHGGIIRTKSEYVFGKGLTYNPDELTVSEQAQYENFLSRANDNDSWNDIFRKDCEPLELIDAVALQVVWKINGKCDVFAMNPLLFRISPEGDKYFYCEAWTDQEGRPTPNPEKHKSFRVFDKFDPDKRNGVQLFYYKIPKLSVVEYGNLYPEPNYIQVLQDIETDIEITNFHYSNLKNGMSASSIVSLFNGEPTQEEKKKIAKLFKNNHTGSNNAGKFILNFVDKNGQPADIKNLTASDIDKQFETLGKRLQQNIFSGHKFDPILGGIKTEGELGGAKEVLEKYDKFVKTYVEYRQEVHLNIIKFFGDINGVDLSKLEVKQTSPVMEIMPSDPNILGLFDTETLKKYYAKRYGIEIEEEEKVKMEALPVNDNIKKLTGAEYRRLQNLISKYKSGKISREEAELFIKGYGLGDDYINIVLGQKFSKVDITDLFEQFSIQDEEGDIVCESFIEKGTDIYEHEFKQHKFSSERSQVLELLKGDPTMTVSKIAKALGLTEERVNEIITALTDAGLITILGSVLNVTEKGLLTKPADIEYETYTVYQYVTRPNVPRAKSSRPFCERLLSLSESGRRWTKEGIDKIKATASEKLSMPDFDPWTYRGGFYNNPQTGETTPYCRHSWKSITKVRRKK